MTVRTVAISRAQRLVTALWAGLLAFLQRRCPHRSEWVLADLLEGDRSANTLEQVRWCRACGAIARACCDGDRPTMLRPDPVDVTRGRQ